MTSAEGDVENHHDDEAPEGAHGSEIGRPFFPLRTGDEFLDHYVQHGTGREGECVRQDRFDQKDCRRAADARGRRAPLANLERP